MGPFRVVSKYGRKGSCSESVMTATARMALTFFWLGRYGGVSQLDPLRRMLSDTASKKHPLVFRASPCTRSISWMGLCSSMVMYASHIRETGHSTLAKRYFSCTVVYVVLSFGIEQLPKVESF